MRTRGISIAIATALYSFFCPKPIKDAATAFELAQRESGYLKAKERPRYRPRDQGLPRPWGQGGVIPKQDALR
jgi:hypothetical protein